MEFGMDGRGGDDLRPGRKLFSAECKNVLCRFIVGDREADVMQHIENCRPCNIVIYGDGKTMPTSIFDDAERRKMVHDVRKKDEGYVPPSADVAAMALERVLLETQSLCNTTTVPGNPALGPIGGVGDEDQTMNASATPALVSVSSHGEAPSAENTPASALRVWTRRRTMRWALTAAAIAVVGGSLRFLTSPTDASRTQNSPTTGVPIAPGRTAAFARWDAYYAGSNVFAVRMAMARAGLSDLIIAFEWIAERRVVALYPDMTAYLADPQIDLRSGALANLFLVPPIDLKPNLTSIQAARAIETDTGMLTAMDQLIAAVAKS